VSLNFRENDIVIFEGDSITRRAMNVNRTDWAYLRMMNWAESYANIAEELIFSWKPELNLKFLHSAIGGSTVKNLLERFDECVKPFKPNWIILTIGNNDVHSIELEEFSRLIKQYAAHVNGELSAKLVFLGGFKELPNYQGDTSGFIKTIPYHKELKRIASETGNYYIDVGEALAEKMDVLCRQYELHTAYGDGLHFNKLGNTIIAGEVLKAFGIIN